MIAAEKWYEYQKQYKKYSFDMKPTEKVIVKVKKKSLTTSRDRLMLMLLTVLTGVICIGLIISTAFSANIKYDINTIIKENAVIQGEIENLNVKIKSAVNIGAIEERATTELGMVYPEVTQFKYLDNEVKAPQNFASIIKEAAYN